MSEELLKALIQLLAIVATEDEVTADERATIENFLLENLSQSEADAYLEVFDKVSTELSAKGKKTNEQDQKELSAICQQMNKELTSRQKTAVMLNLIILIIADGKITDRERELLYFIGNQINISKKLIDYLKAFVLYTDRSKLISSHILIIDNGTFEISEKSKHLKNANLEGFLFFLRIPDTEIYFLKYIGTQHLTLNGDPLRTNKIYPFSSGSSIRGEVIQSIYYSDVVNAFKSEEQTTKLSFLADNVSYKFKNGNIGLRNVQIAESGGRLIGLMGASGSGKSTLLNVLNGNETPTSGSVRINGIDIHLNKKEIEGVIGYVPQDDLLMEDLTVFQNLYYAAKLCFKDYSKGELVDLVENTLESLGLTETRDLKVGSPLEKTISGGQRKRLNIGLELLREPSVLYVDEPTSGLSSRDSENIMDLLRDLSLKGKMIFVVIHQPSLDIFKMFDKLIILDVGGYQIYYGNPLEGINYFKNIVNLKDQATPNPEQIFNIVEAKVVNEYGHFTKNRKIVPEQWYEHFRKNIQIPRIKEITDEPTKTLKIPNKIKQAATFTIRDVLGKLSNKQYLIINFLEAPVLALLLAFIVRYIPANQEGYIFRLNENLPVFFFMSVIVALFMGLTVSAEEIIKDRKILKRESFLNLSRGSYILSKLIILFALSAIQTITFVIVGNLILEIKGMTLSYWAVLLSISFFANVLGLNISSAFKSVVTIYILIPLLIIPQLILSGVVVSFDKLNPSISAQDKVPLIGEIMASRWAYEALAVSQFTDNAYESNFYEYDQAIAMSEYKVVYMIPNLMTKLEYCHLHNGNEGQEVLDQITYNLNVIRSSIRDELGDATINSNYPFVNDLTTDKFSEETYTKTDKLLKTIKAHYNSKSNEASDAKEQLINDMRENGVDLLRLKDLHYNDRMSYLVKNTSTAIRMLEEEGELIQKIYPIYMDAYGDHPLDFRGQFYQPNKSIFYQTIPTLWFNIAIIWVMSIILVITLYFDVLRKIISGKRR